MPASSHIRVLIDLGRIQENVQRLARQTRVAVIAVIKADAYGLGAERIAPAVADLVDSFCVFSAEEAAAISLWDRTGKPAIAIGPPPHGPARDECFVGQHVRPAVSTVEQARAFRAADPVLCVDTGQQRFACPLEEAVSIISAGGCREAFTHAITLEQIRRFRNAIEGKVSRMHAAGSSLLGEPEARLDAVRPGMAMYQRAARVWGHLIETHKSRGPAGYTGFQVPWHGVMIGGYSNGLRAGPCMINGRPSRILEVGMQTAFVEIQPTDKPGDEVVLLGDGITEQQLSQAWTVSPQEALHRIAGAGARTYKG